jgi:hypothetical protein
MIKLLKEIKKKYKTKKALFEYFNKLFHILPLAQVDEMTLIQSTLMFRW